MLWTKNNDVLILDQKHGMHCVKPKMWSIFLVKSKLLHWMHQINTRIVELPNSFQFLDFECVT